VQSARETLVASQISKGKLKFAATAVKVLFIQYPGLLPPAQTVSIVIIVSRSVFNHCFLVAV
jgi:hypothetical protein